MAGRGTDELAGLRREELVDGTGVLALDGLARQDHGTAVDVIASQSRLLVGTADEVVQLVRIDRAIGQERGEHDRRPPQDLAMGHHELAGQALGKPPEGDPGEQEVRSGAPDVDADRTKLDRLLLRDHPADGGLIRLAQRLMFVIELEVVRHARRPL